MKNKLIFALTFLISVVIVRKLMLKYFIDISPIIVAVAFLLIQRDKFSSFNFRLFKPMPFLAIMIITYTLLFLTIISLTQFKLAEFSKPDKGILYYVLIPPIAGLTEEIAWRGYLFSKLKELTWLQITIIINLIWSIWHIPTHYYSLEGHFWISFPLFIASCFELGIIMQYLRVKTDSVIPCILFHALFIVPFMLAGLKTRVLYLGSFPSIIMLLFLLPITIYCYSVGQRIHDKELTLTRTV
jgi:membrane protease YdiL (CAAX protease family)